MLLLAFTASGCSLFGCDRIEVEVESTAITNDGLPFYMVVRTADEKTFLTESYQTVADKVFASPAEPSIITSEVIFPGSEKSVEFKRPEDENAELAIYFFFSKPGDRWKAMVSKPLPGCIAIQLEGSEIKELE